ncbi:hypothetical protein CSPX01_14663 [Colletotrichum filicis]|nr:hypothetical protein CSPX01_14663 [Colletotrichum filicis]
MDGKYLVAEVHYCVLYGVGKQGMAQWTVQDITGRSPGAGRGLAGPSFYRGSDWLGAFSSHLLLLHASTATGREAPARATPGT